MEQVEESPLLQVRVRHDDILLDFEPLTGVGRGPAVQLEVPVPSWPSEAARGRSCGIVELCSHVALGRLAVAELPFLRRSCRRRWRDLESALLVKRFVPIAHRTSSRLRRLVQCYFPWRFHFASSLCNVLDRSLETDVVGVGDNNSCVRRRISIESLSGWAWASVLYLSALSPNDKAGSLAQTMEQPKSPPNPLGPSPIPPCRLPGDPLAQDTRGRNAVSRLCSLVWSFSHKSHANTQYQHICINQIIIKVFDLITDIKFLYQERSRTRGIDITGLVTWHRMSVR